MYTNMYTIQYVIQDIEMFNTHLPKILLEEFKRFYAQKWDF